MQLIINSPISWLLLALLLGFLMYAMMRIKGEQQQFLDECIEYGLGEFILPIANWWTATEQKDQELLFQRVDTQYDWFAKFQQFHGSTNLNKLLDQIIEECKLDFDEDVIIETQPSYVFQDTKLCEEIKQLIRVEGKASKDITDRIYIDLVLIQTECNYYIFESTSSVLNGSVEGPYFEETLKHLKLF